MGNQHSAPDKDKDRDKEAPKELPKDGKDKAATGDPVRTGSKHEKHRSRTITSAPLPPAETKVNADHSHNVPTSGPAVALPIPSTATTSSASEGRSLEPKTSIESSAAGSGTASPAKARRTSKTIAQKDVADAIKEMHLKDVSPSNDQVPDEGGLEPTPKFETLRVASQTSLVDEDEDNDADKDGRSVIVEDLRVGPEKVPLVLDWTDGGKKVAVAGTFTGWRKRINLRKTYLTNLNVRRGPDCRNGRFSTVVQVRPGTHRFHFLVDGEWRISNEFPTAVDSEGNLLNYFEASEFSDNEEIELSRSTSISWHEPEVQKDTWTRKIPSYVARIPDSSPNYNGRYSPRWSLTDEEIIPPALPRQLEKPFLNQNHIEKDDQSVLPQPAHVVLNHLGVATSIKDNVLAVSCTNRYRGKYVTSILYKQVDEE